jgi:5-methylcytosine-specific restriction endonuclease McrA
MPKTARPAIPKGLQVAVYRRDRWLCHWCGRPVIFAPAMRYLEHFVRSTGVTEPLAYHHAHWTRRDAPLLDYMGAVIDHVEAHSGGGKSDKSNLVTACCKCNALKSDAKFEVFQAKLQHHTVKGKYGEPRDWDGLSTLFVILAEREPRKATASERDWLKCLKPAASSAKQI